MKLQYLGHSSFVIISDMGTTVLCDPFDADMVGLSFPKVRCDVVTISHHHGDHDCTTNVVGNPAIIDEVVSGGADDIAIDAISTFHDDCNGAKRGKNIVFTFVVDGLKVAHLGDIGCKDDNLVEFIRDCDVLLLPVGGVYTINATVAKWYVDNVHPQIAVPMHYGTPNHKFRLDGLDKFTCLFDKSDVITKPSCSLDLFDKPDNGQTQIIVLQSYED